MAAWQTWVPFFINSSWVSWTANTESALSTVHSGGRSDAATRQKTILRLLDGIPRPRRPEHPAPRQQLGCLFEWGDSSTTSDIGAQRASTHSYSDARSYLFERNLCCW